MNESDFSKGIVTRLVDQFLDGQFSIILLIVAFTLGISAIVLTPREEDPQIVVPLADIYVRYPGGSSEEVEKLVATPLERLLWQIDGVEYVYSVSRRDKAIITVRFHVGEDRERSLVKLHNKISSHIDEAPPGVSDWVIKPIEIDDVPIITLTLYSRKYDDHQLRRIGEEALTRLAAVEDVSRTQIIGGRKLEVRVELDPESLKARGQSALEVYNNLTLADASLTVGSFDRQNIRLQVDAGPFLEREEDIRNLVIGVYHGNPVYLRDVARVQLIAEEATNYTRLGIGPANSLPMTAETYPAVTLAIAKKKGTNAVDVADAILDKMKELENNVIPSEVDIHVTRNYGDTADEKVNDLLSSLFLAMVTVIGLLLVTLGVREGLIVALSVPVSFSLALFVNYIFGYTINRVTLFALILTLGIVVDDPITNVDNIQRHILMKLHDARKATLYAVQEVLVPVIMSTLTIVVSFLPMFFITGMMGPYMQPMAVNVPLTVIFSTVAALTIVPWATFKLLRTRVEKPESASVSRGMESDVSPMLLKLYRSFMEPLLRYSSFRIGLFILVGILFLVAIALPLARLVPMKMLPFDNKNELQIVLNTKEGSTLEATDAVVRDFENYLFTVPEVTDFESYVGTYSPIDFNGLVRHYYFRVQPNLADIRVNLAPKQKRKQQSHEIALRLRRDLEAIALRNGAKLAIVESPPGPPVISTLVAEVYGPPNRTYKELMNASQTVISRLKEEHGVVDIDTSVEAVHSRVQFVLDKEKSGLHGITTKAVAQTLSLALAGASPATLHKANERTPLSIQVQIPREQRSGIPELGRITVKGSNGELIPLDELGEFKESTADMPIFHKNLERVVYVFAEMAGRAPGEAILDIQSYFRKNPLPQGIFAKWDGEGEWDITLRVFRDLGLAFGAALIGIYILLVIQTKSFIMPFVIMSAIPLTMIGIMPGFWILNSLGSNPVGGFDNPVFFTATAMIGMITLGGIVVRNSIILIEFIQGALREGRPLYDAIIQSGAIRMRPILLTAISTALGAWPITLDPIFSGLAWSLIFGLSASTAFTLLVVPVMYYMIYANKPELKNQPKQNLSFS